MRKVFSALDAALHWRGMSTEHTVAEIASHVGGRVLGEPQRRVAGVSSLEAAGPGDLVFVEGAQYEAALRRTKALAALLPEGMEPNDGMSGIQVGAPALAMAAAVELLVPRVRAFTEVSPQAFLGKDVQLGADVGVGPGAYVGDGVRVGRGTEIHPGATVARGVTIGEDCIIYSGAHIYHDTVIGNRVIIHSAAVLGSDGFGFAQAPASPEAAAAGEPIFHRKIPQVGRVVLEDDVEIGACTAIDRAALQTTRIGRGTKVDNLVQIAHNCEAGKHCLIVSQTGLSGSTKLEDYVTLAGQVGAAGHLTVGTGTTVAARSGISKDVPPGKVVWGTPADDIQRVRRSMAIARRLPELRDTVLKLERRLAELEAHRSEGGSRG